MQHKVHLTVKVSVIYMKSFRPEAHRFILVLVVKCDNSPFVHQICSFADVCELHRVKVLLELKLILTDQ